MTCTDTVAGLDALIDDELPPDAAAELRAHIDACAGCRARYDERRSLSQTVRSTLMRYEAPDILKARIRANLAAEHAPVPTRAAGWRQSNGRWVIAASIVLVAFLSSVVTRDIVGRRNTARAVEAQIVSSHIRSLMPGHLTDIASNDQHNVKPWFNGRVALSPPVVHLDSIGFRLVGGRIDYVGGQSVPVSVYMRRQHVINVFAWPEASGAPRAVDASINGYNLLQTTIGGLELWFVSDLNVGELTTFMRHFEETAR